MLWVDKYRPSSLGRMSYHKGLSDRLAKLADAADIPHMLFYGPSGAGKKTRIMALLRAVFGGSVEKMKLEHRTFKTPSNKSIEVTTVASNHHIEINPGDAGIYDRYVVQEVIKEIASYGSLDKGFKVVVLSEVDRLTKDAQHALRRTMEKYSGSCRIILCCESPSRVIEPVRSRCLGIRVAAPSVPEVMAVLENICSRESLSLPKAFAAKIAGHSKGNLRRAILMLEACKVHTYPFSMQQPVQLPDWERFIMTIADDMVTSQTPGTLLHVRGKLYQLLVNCIPASTIIRTLTHILISHRAKFPDELKRNILADAAAYEHRMLKGQKDIFHLEAFIAKVLYRMKELLYRKV